MIKHTVIKKIMIKFIDDLGLASTLNRKARAKAIEQADENKRMALLALDRII